MARSPSREIQRRSRCMSRVELLLALVGGTQPLRGVEPGLDPLGQLDLLLGVEQRDLADLLEVGPDRVGGGGQLGVPAGLLERLGLLVVPLEVVVGGRLGGVGLGGPGQLGRLLDDDVLDLGGELLGVDLTLGALALGLAGGLGRRRPRPPSPWGAGRLRRLGGRRCGLGGHSAGGGGRLAGGRLAAAAGAVRLRRRRAPASGRARRPSWSVLAVVASEARGGRSGGGDPAAGAGRAVDHHGDAGLGERAQDLLGLGRSHLGGLDRTRELGRRELPAGALRVGDQGVGERANVGAGLVGFCHE